MIRTTHITSEVHSVIAGAFTHRARMPPPVPEIEQARRLAEALTPEERCELRAHLERLGCERTQPIQSEAADACHAAARAWIADRGASPSLLARCAGTPARDAARADLARHLYALGYALVQIARAISVSEDRARVMVGLQKKKNACRPGVKKERTRERKIDRSALLPQLAPGITRGDEVVDTDGTRVHVTGAYRRQNVIMLEAYTLEGERHDVRLRAVMPPQSTGEKRRRARVAAAQMTIDDRLAASRAAAQAAAETRRARAEREAAE